MEIQIDPAGRFTLVLPEEGGFRQADLSKAVGIGLSGGEREPQGD